MLYWIPSRFPWRTGDKPYLVDTGTGKDSGRYESGLAMMAGYFCNDSAIKTGGSAASPLPSRDNAA
jgi:hypothetical protein